MVADSGSRDSRFCPQELFIADAGRGEIVNGFFFVCYAARLVISHLVMLHLVCNYN